MGRALRPIRASDGPTETLHANRELEKMVGMQMSEFAGGGGVSVTWQVANDAEKGPWGLGSPIMKAIYDPIV